MPASTATPRPGIPSPAGRGLLRLDREPILGIPRSAFHVAVGAPLALLLAWAPILRYAGWFMGALVHELGHTVAALYVGCLALPAISLAGHAAAFHAGQKKAAALLIWAGLAGLAVWSRRDRRALAVFAVLAATYPVLAFTGFRDVFHLVAGHLGELVFAAVFFWRALVGGFVHQEGERPLYAMLGWFWMGGNAFLFSSLTASEASRQWYRAHGSFGLQNDFVRLAGIWGVPLETVTAPMILVSCLPLPAALLMFWFVRREEKKSIAGEGRTVA